MANDVTSVPTILSALSIPSRLGVMTSYSGKGVGIAIIDSGFAPHPDLTKPRNRIVRYYDAVQGIERRLPPKGTAFYAWHGTMTACTACGNGFQSHYRYSSLAPEASVILIRTMHENGRIPTATIVHALEWCLKNAKRLRLRIVNISVYADEIDHDTDHPVTDLIEKLSRNGIVVVAAAGNDCQAPLRPPAVAPSAITVGGLDDRNTHSPDDNTLYHSSFGTSILGQRKPELIAPAIWLPAPMLIDTAEQVEASTLCALDALSDDNLLKVLPLLLSSTRLPATLGENSSVSTIRMHIAQRIIREKIISPFYKHVDGTSFAAPIVASAAAQLLEINPGLTPEDVKHILTVTARPLDQFPGERQGHGIIDTNAAVELAARYGTRKPEGQHTNGLPA